MGIAPGIRAGANGIGSHPRSTRWKRRARQPASMGKVEQGGSAWVPARHAGHPPCDGPPHARKGACHRGRAGRRGGARRRHCRAMDERERRRHQSRRGAAGNAAVKRPAPRTVTLESAPRSSNRSWPLDASRDEEGGRGGPKGPSQYGSSSASQSREARHPGLRGPGRRGAGRRVRLGQQRPGDRGGLGRSRGSAPCEGMSPAFRVAIAKPGDGRSLSLKVRRGSPSAQAVPISAPILRRAWLARLAWSWPAQPAC